MSELLHQHCFHYCSHDISLSIFLLMDGILIIKMWLCEQQTVFKISLGVFYFEDLFHLQWLILLITDNLYYHYWYVWVPIGHVTICFLFISLSVPSFSFLAFFWIIQDVFIIPFLPLNGFIYPLFYSSFSGTISDCDKRHWVTCIYCKLVFLPFQGWGKDIRTLLLLTPCPPCVLLLSGG